MKQYLGLKHSISCSLCDDITNVIIVDMEQDLEVGESIYLDETLRLCVPCFTSSVEAY